MADVVVTMRIMGASPETDLKAVDKEVRSIIEKNAGKGAYQSREEPVAFGIKALIVSFVMPEEGGKTDAIENEIQAIEGVESVSTIDVRRSIG